MIVMHLGQSEPFTLLLVSLLPYSASFLKVSPFLINVVEDRDMLMPPPRYAAQKSALTFAKLLREARYSIRTAHLCLSFNLEILR